MSDILEDLIEIGIDAVHCQLFAMDIEALATDPQRITFWGEIDRQQVLPKGTREDVAAAVRSTCRRHSITDAAERSPVPVGCGSPVPQHRNRFRELAGARCRCRRDTSGWRVRERRRARFRDNTLQERAFQTARIRSAVGLDAPSSSVIVVI